VATIRDQARPAPAAKYDAAVDAYLARARRRIRSLDAAVAVLILLSGSLAFTLGMILLDRWLVLSPLSRQVALAGYALAALVYLVIGLLLPLARRINPYYAARHLEQAVPGAKNSVVNWLDLRAEPLPPAIRSAVGQRAARDLQRADLDQAISGRRAAWLGGLTAALFLAAFVALLLLGGRPFFSLLGRTFVPFREGVIATRTQLTLVEPAGGNVTVPVGRSVRFTAEVEGRVPDPGKPDALRLLFHYQPGDPYEERPLEHDSGAEWTTTLPAFQVQNGIWYKVAGGDAETAEFRVQVRATPLVEGFEATYHYRPYLGWRDDTTRDPNLRALRGTEVRLVAHTNRVVRIKDSRLELEVPKADPVAAGNTPQEQRLAPEPAKPPETINKSVPAEPVPDDPQGLAFRLVLDQSGKYRVKFMSAEGETNTDPPAYTIQVLPDHEPRVELTKPGEDVTLPANGVLRLEGLATDDIGLKALTLRMQVRDGAKLRARPYRDGKSFRLEDGGYPTTLRYKDFVDLASVQDQDGKPVVLQPKTEVEYWLEATDDCDYPAPNVGRSKTYKVTIGDPETDKAKEEQERQKAQDEQKQHEAKQDEQLKKENENPRPDQNPDHDGQNQKPEKQQDNRDKQEQDKQQEQSQGAEQPDKKQGEQRTGSQEKNPGHKDGGDKGEAGQQDQKQQADKQQGGTPQAGNQEGKNQHGDKQQGGEQQGGGESAGQSGQQDQREQQAKKLAQAIKQEQQRSGNKGESGQGANAEKQAGEAGDGRHGEQTPNNDAPKNGKQGVESTPKAGENSHTGEKQPAAGAERTGQEPQSAKGEHNATGQSEPRPQTGDKQQGASQPGAQGDRQGDKTSGQGAAAGEKSTQTGAKGEPQPMAGAGQERNGSKEPAGTTGDKGAQKPDQEKTGSDGAARDQEKGPGGEKDPAHMSAEDVRRLSEKAAGGNEKERQEAARKLEQASQQAKDPAAREAAGKALAEQAQQEKKQASPAAAKSGPKESDQRDAAKEGRPGECKNCSGGNPGAGGGKSGGGSAPGQSPQGTAKGEGTRRTAQGGNPSEPTGKPSEGSPAGSAKGRGDRIQPDGAPGPGQGGGHVSNNEPAPGGEDQTPDRPAETNQPRRPGELVLEDLRKTLEELKKHPEEMKKVLDRAGLKEKDLRDVQKYLDEKLPAPQQGGSLSNLGARQVAPGQGKAADTKVNGPALPPPGFRDSTREFTRKLAEPDKE
jgi:hypothetical protein